MEAQPYPEKSSASVQPAMAESLSAIAASRSAAAI